MGQENSGQGDPKNVAKESFAGNSLYIELGHSLYQSGETIEGIVHMNLVKMCYPAVNLTVGLYGAEQTKYTKSEEKWKSTGNGSRMKTVVTEFVGSDKIVDMRHTLQEYPDDLTAI